VTSYLPRASARKLVSWS